MVQISLNQPRKIDSQELQCLSVQSGHTLLPPFLLPFTNVMMFEGRPASSTRHPRVNASTETPEIKRRSIE